jgi:hypothetical protein
LFGGWLASSSTQQRVVMASPVRALGMGFEVMRIGLAREFRAKH